MPTKRPDQPHQPPFAPHPASVAVCKISFSRMALGSTSGNGPDRVRRGTYVEHHIDQPAFCGLHGRHLEGIKVGDALGGESTAISPSR